jgi:hypothetical protein
MTTCSGHGRRFAGSVRGGAGWTAGFRGVAIALALVMLAGLARPALAADEAEPAQAHLRRSAAATNLGHYADAAKEYEAAYLWTSAPNLLVDVGRTWQLAGDQQKALTAFRSYVRVAPDGEHRAFCEAKIRELEGQPTGPAAPVPGPTAPAMAPSMMAYPAPGAVPPLPAPAPMAPVPPPLYAAPPRPPVATTIATCPPPVPVATESPVYHRWPFWIVLGTVVIAGTAVAIWYTRDRDLAMPTTTFGTKQF